MAELEELSPNLPDLKSALDSTLEKILNLLSWGRLVSLKEASTPKDLINDCYKIGKAPSCDIIPSLESAGPYFSNISNLHFKLCRISTEDQNVSFAYLEDLSRNGTFVNGKIVGKNKKVLLSSHDEISFPTPKNTVYLFLSECPGMNQVQQWLPVELINDYLVLRNLGQGSYGEVKLVVNKNTCEKYALKKLSNGIGDKKIPNEMNILEKLNHPYIIKFYNGIETPESFCLLLEYMPNGNLRSKIKSETKISQMESRIIFYQLLLAVEYLHNNEIIHRDLKPENILLSRPIDMHPYSGPLVKVSDFGLAKILDTQTSAKSACGTLMYAAPEVVFASSFGRYDKKVDIWSLGIILFYCLAGVYPFKVEELKLPLTSNYHKRYKVHHNLLPSPNAYSYDLIRKMTVVDSKLRIDLSSIFQHHWLTESNDILKRLDIALDENHEVTNESSKKPKLM